MLHYCLRIFFIYVLYTIHQVKCDDFVAETESSATRFFKNIVHKKRCKDCSCPDIIKSDGVICDDVDGNYIGILEFSHSKNLSAKMLMGLRIGILLLNDSGITVAENFLEGASHLGIFKAQQSGIQTVPNFRIVKDSIKCIIIESSRLTSLEGENLQNLPSIQWLSFAKNGIKSIDQNVFKGMNNLGELDLSHNLLTFIPPTLLDSMKILYWFSARYNNLLHVNKLFSVTHPTFILLDHNNITSVSSFLHFDDLWFSDLYGFAGVYKIRLLDLSYNFIKELPMSFFSSLRSAFDGMPFLRVERLRLKGNELQYLNASFRYSQIMKFEVSKNKLQYLSGEGYSFGENTDHLELQENHIRWIDTSVFKQIRASLLYLDLSCNNIISINGSVRSLSHLRLLNLSHNSIQSLAEDEFTGLYELYKLELQYNQIKAFGQFHTQLSKLQHLTLSHNNIELMKPKQLPMSLKFLNLTDNFLKCDCNIQPFINELETNPHLVNTAVCSLFDPPQHSTCPDMCSCRCVDDGKAAFMFVDCSSKNLSDVPQFLRSESEDNVTSPWDIQGSFVIPQNGNSSFDLKDRVLGFSLENNNLEFLDGTLLPPNLTQLYLSNNKLKMLPESLFEKQQNLKQVSLSRNPWNCDCSISSMKFKKWLTSKIDFQDKDNIRCGKSSTGGKNLTGRVISELTELDLCPTNDEQLHILVSFGVLTFVILSLLIKVLYAKYELNIKVFLYSHGLTFVKEDDFNYDKEFDAFISFSHTDDEFVIKEIISVIEDKDPNIRLHLHYRHFMPGEFIADNILYAVKNSKKTVLILSRNFLESEWCLLEFRTAHIQSLEDKVHRLIVVKLGELPKEIDPVIKVYLDSTTYLTWGESNFWKKLLFILPSRSNIRNPVPRNPKDYEVAFNLSSLSSQNYP